MGVKVKEKSEPAFTDKQERFCQEYVIDLNGKQAAIRAGYAESTAEVQASRLLSYVKVGEKIAELQKGMLKRSELSADMVIQELRTIGFAKVTDFLKVETETITTPGLSEKDEPTTTSYTRVKIFNTDEVDQSKLPAIAAIKEGRNGIEIKMHDKVQALELLGKHLGIFEKDNRQKAPVIQVGYGEEV